MKAAFFGWDKDRKQLSLNAICVQTQSGKGGHFRCFAYWTTSSEADLQLNGLHGKLAKSPSKLQGEFK